MNKFNITKDNALLLIIDMQERMCAALNQDCLKKVLRQIGLLSLYAKKENLPVIVTEQYPKGLGKTLPVVLKGLEGVPYDCFDKVSFGCAGDDAFLSYLKEKYADKKIILTGTETQVCIYLTALGLMNEGFDVFVAQDAVMSRSNKYHDYGLQQMRDLGAVMTNAESLVFGFMQKAGGETFKEISQYIKLSGSE